MRESVGAEGPVEFLLAKAMVKKTSKKGEGKEGRGVMQLVF